MSTVVAQRTPSPQAAAEHSVRFYEQDEALLEEVAEYLDRALRAGGLAVAIATAPHRVELERRLSGFGGPVGRAGAWFSGSLRLLDASETLACFMVDGQPDARRFETVIGPIFRQAPPGRPLHAFGEMVAVLCERSEYEAALELEALWNQLAAQYRFSLFCAYPRRLFSAGGQRHAFQHVCAAHGWVRGHEGLPADTDTTVGSLRARVAELQAQVARLQSSEETLHRRESELREFLDNASEGIHKVAGDGTILYANRAELQMLGYEWDEYVGRNIAEFYVDESLIRDILGRLQCGEVLRDQPAVLRCKDGSHKHVLIHSSGCYERGELQYTRCFTRDATERVARERALAEAAREREVLLEQAREASRAKDEFLAMLGHELRNPLSPIVTALQLMRMRGETGTEREQAIIRRQVDHMVRLVDDLLDISRITRGMIELKCQPVDLSAVLANAVEQVSVLLEQRRHRLVLQVEEGIRCHCDPTRVAQVVVNLLTNAARYTDPGGMIELRLCREGERVAIRVKDTGRGIPPQLLARIFDLFFQGHRGLDRSEGGLGIGLALVRSLVELHGGSVQALSEGEGRGSEFIVRLPSGEPAGAGTPEGAQALAPGAQARPGACRVMLVDDNADAVETLGELLRIHGHEVCVFTDPLRALEQLDALRPQVAVLDIGLPVIDGYELGARIRAQLGTGCLLVALSGYGTDADKARSDAAGFDHHLTKPVVPAQLLELLP